MRFRRGATGTELVGSEQRALDLPRVRQFPPTCQTSFFPAVFATPM